MIRSYLTTAFRSIRRAPGVTLINITGLALGLTCCLVILRYVEDEMRFDRFHAGVDRIFRVTRETLEGGVVTREQANTPAAVGPALLDEYPAVESMTRFLFPYPNQVVVRRGGRSLYEPGFLWADSSLFDVFSFKLLQGHPRSVLSEPYSLVLTQSAARRYFGDENPVGQTLVLEGWTTDTYRITGILEDPPAHSHLQFGLLASMSGAERVYSSLFEGEGAWGNSLVYTYVRLKDRTSSRSLIGHLPDFTERHLGGFQKTHGIRLRFHLQPLTGIHLDPTVKTILETNGDFRYVFAFSTIAALVLVVACVNFTNLAIAHAARRGREVGLRKVLGADRRQFMVQFLTESVLLSLCAFGVALGLVQLALPLFNDLSGKTFDLTHFVDPGRILLWFGLALIVGLLAGLYPAAFWSIPAPLHVFKGAAHPGTRRAFVRRALVVFQFAVAISLLAGTGIIYDQLTYMRQKNLGFTEEQLVVIPLPEQPQDVATLAQAWRGHPGVIQVSAASGVPGRPGLSDTWSVRTTGEGTQVNMLAVMADPEYIETLGLELVAGRTLSRAFATDTSAGFLINETAVRALGFDTPEEAVGRQLDWQQGSGKRGVIVGVLRDFHFRSLHQTIEPTLVHVFPERYTLLAVRLRPENVRATLTFLERRWKALMPEAPFAYTFLDQTLDALYRSDTRLGQTIGVFALLGVLIACLGLFGLAMQAAEQRTKEIGVRKSLGATAFGLAWLFSKEFARLVGIAFVVATPPAYFALQRWLDNFAYRAETSAWTFIGAGLFTLFFALAAVSYQAIRTARVDPVQALRYE